ncbi:MAG: hypothetical protein MUO72_13135 [Bacteroidales bacterium]|nr:hypothetical protein [Bacteroidales bacterium]
MTRNLNTAVISILMFVSLTDGLLIAQTKTDEKILTQLNNFCSNFPYEEIYVHSDREDYIAGEDVWFNVFVVDRKTGKQSGKSRLAYFELLNPDNFPVVQKRIIIRDGYGPGNVLLPDTLSSGTYTLRVYTNWMKNFLPVNCFMKNINIYNPLRDKSFKRKIIYENRFRKNRNIEFYPEGRTLLSGVPSKVAVKVFDRYQRSQQFAGVIRDIKGDSVTYFKTDEYGTASFELIPAYGNKYYVSTADSVTYLPEVSDKGYALKVDNFSNDLISILVSVNENIVSDINKTFLLFIHTRGTKDYSEYFRISGNNVRITIPKTSLTPGINHITLFGNDGNPLCERLIFTNGRDLSGLSISGNDNYKRREKVTLELDLEKAGITSSKETNLGISVTPQSAEMYTREIDDYLVFGTEFGYLPWDGIKGRISDIDNKMIDNFLITAKSRWISWNDILSGKTDHFKFMHEEEGHLLSGWLKKRNSPEIDTGGVLYLSVPGKVATFQYARTDSTGYFNFLLPADYSRKNLIIQPALPDDNITIEIEPSFSWILPTSVSYTDSLNKGFPHLVSNLGASYQVNKIYGTVLRKENQTAENQIPGTVRFYGKPEQEVFMDDYIKLPVMQEIFFELVPGTRLRSRKSGYEMRIMNPLDNIFYTQPPLVMIDGVIINDHSLLANLDPETIEKIDVTRTPYLTGDLLHYGIVNVITRTGNLRNITLADYAARLPYKVADPIPSFYAPDYSDPGTKQSRIPDFRNTLFWSPSLKPDKDGKVRIEFWTSDSASDYIVNIQGMTGDGELISVKKSIRVSQ